MRAAETAAQPLYQSPEVNDVTVDDQEAA